jgi:trypsin-like peptidase
VMVIPSDFLDCCLYVYSSKSQAEAGEFSGGSGFVVSVPLTVNKGWAQLYAVTALHVIENRRNPVLRVNTEQGGFDCLETNGDRWHKFKSVDLAILPIDIEDSTLRRYRLSLVSLKDFVSSAERRNGIFVGDEVFMVGRFISHEGKQRNTPSVRYGNISMMYPEPTKNKYGHEQETLLVEHRSLPGYSGSPVFVFINPALPRPPLWGPPNKPDGLYNFSHYNPEFHGPWLLGIDWCHIHDYEPVLGSDKETPAKPNTYVKAHTGMAGIIPAWVLAEHLNSQELQMQRDIEDQKITETNKAGHVIFDSAPEKEFTKADFEDALRKVSRRLPPSQSDEEK